MKDLFQLLFSKDFEDKLDGELDKTFAESGVSIEEIIREIAEHYSSMAASVAPGYHSITVGRTNFRQVHIDGKLYDLDAVITHRQAALYEHLLAIDSLFSDLTLQDSDLEKCILAIEDRLIAK